MEPPHTTYYLHIRVCGRWGKSRCPVSGARFQTSGAKGGGAHACGVGNLRFQTYFTPALSWNSFYILDPKARSPPLDGNDRASPPRTRGSTSGGFLPPWRDGNDVGSFSAARRTHV